MITRALIVFLALSSSLTAQSAWDLSAPEPGGFDRGWAQSTTLDHLTDLVALDTRNPPGHEQLTVNVNLAPSELHNPVLAEDVHEILAETRLAPERLVLEITESGVMLNPETALRTMYDSGYRGDVYPALAMWEMAPTGMFASYPFPESLDVMRTGGS